MYTYYSFTPLAARIIYAIEWDITKPFLGDVSASYHNVNPCECGFVERIVSMYLG